MRRDIAPAHLPTVAMALVFRAEAHGLRGETDVAEELVEEALTLAPDDPVMAAEAWHMRGTRWLLNGDQDRALVALDRAMEFVEMDSAATTPALGRWVVLATLVRGGPDPLRRAFALPGGRTARWTRAHTRFAEAIELGRRGDADAATAAFDAADAAMTVPVPMPHYRHMARRLAAEAAVADGWGNPAVWLPEDVLHFNGAGHDRVPSRSTWNGCTRRPERPTEPISVPTPRCPARTSRDRHTGVTDR